MWLTDPPRLPKGGAARSSPASTSWFAKIAKLRDAMQRLAGIEARMLESPDQQVSLTDPDARSMATSGRGSGVVGYNVQIAVETAHHLIVAPRSPMSVRIARSLPPWRRQPGAPCLGRDTRRAVGPSLPLFQR